MQRITGFLFLLVFVGCTSKKDKIGSKQKPTPVAVDVLIADTTQLQTTLDVNGNILPFETVDIHAETSGRLTLLNMEDGAAVSQGQILARINDADLQAQLKKLESQLELATSTEARQLKLLSIHAINQAEYDQSLNQLQNIRADLQFIQAQIDKTIIRAPFNGTLGLRMVSPGAYVTPQTQLGTLSQTGKYKLDFSVPEEKATSLKKGMMVYVIADASKDSIPARIIAMESSVNSSSGNLKIRAIPDRGQFIPGAYVKVCIPQSVGQNTIRVPTQAIIPEATAKKLIVVKNGKGQFVKVKTGVRTSSEVEITEGIQPGDTIVVNGILFVKPGAELKISKIISH